MVRINLLPVKVSKKKEAGKQQLVLFAVLLLAGIVANYMWTGARARDLSQRTKLLAKTKADIAQLDKIIGEVTNIRAEQKALQDKLDVLDKLKAARSGPVRMLDELSTIVPPRLTLKKLDEKGGKVTFEGVAGNIDDVSTFMSALKNSKYFGAVELKRTEGKNVGGFRVTDFSITAAARYAPDVAPTAEATPGSASGPAKKGG